ncbi:MAG: transcription antitermination factor NusB [Tannerellaceae bacterium]|nr:transcription antitermination factor NusB [Tannerellaceae bacterium]
MINRLLIRIKVLQVLYAWYQNGNNNLKAAENEILFSLQKSYDLYYYMLLLLIDVTRLQDYILTNRKNRYLPTPEELNPNMRFVDNRFIKQLASNRQFNTYVEEKKVSWVNDRDFVKSVLDLILSTDEYAAYMSSNNDSYDADKEFWQTIFKNYICENEMISDYLEDLSIYWNDDVDIVATFVLKTIKKFKKEEGVLQPLLPMFSDIEDRYYAIQLLRKSIMFADEYREMIDAKAKNWEHERIAGMDIYIMQIAVAELLAFPSIPISVTLNEYIDLSKYYSTPKSYIFVNGILDAIVNDLKNDNRLFKE